MFSLRFSPRMFYKAAIFSLLSGFYFQKFRNSQTNGDSPSNSNSFLAYNSNLNPELKELLLSIAENLKINSAQDDSLKNEEILFQNGRDEKKIFTLNSFEDIIKIQHFNSPPKFSQKEDLVGILKVLPENEQVFVCIDQKNNLFNELRYGFVSNQTHFYFSDSEIQEIFGLNSSEIGLIKKKRESFEVEGGKQQVISLNETDFIIEKIDLNDGAIKQKMLDFCLDGVNFVKTENELINLLRISKDNDIQKFLLYTPFDKEDVILDGKKTKKLLSICKNHQKTQIIYTKNEGLLRNFFKVIPEKYIDTVRLIDFNAEIKSELENKTIIYQEESQINNFTLSLADYHQKLLPKEYQMNKFGKSRVCRYKYEGKITRNRLQEFFNRTQNNLWPQYYECNLNYQKKYSFYLNSKNFKENVLDSHQEWLILNYKPGCTSCKVFSLGFEKFVLTLNEIQEFLKQIDNNSITYNRHENNIINKYKILNMEKFKNLRVARYNLFNECKEFAAPSSAPLLFFFKSNKNKPPIIIDLLKERVNINDQSSVVETLIRIIDNRL